MSHVRTLHVARAVATPSHIFLALLCSCLTMLPASISGAQQVASRNISATDTTAFAQPGDVVRLKIWREPDMSGDYTVDANGIATFPRLGATNVSRMGADSLQRWLVAEYARFLRNPSVEVVLMRRVRVVGAVRTPGLYTADPTMHVRDVLALAGGATAEGRTDFVRLDRNGRSTPVDLNRAPRAGEIGLRSGDQLYVPQRSWLARNTPLVAAIVSVGGGLLIALSTR